MMDNGAGAGFVAQENQIRRPAGLVEEVYTRLRAQIMSLKIPPDTRISVDSLVRELGVSHTPIREALSMLEAIGLVTRKRFIGYCTAPELNSRQLDELAEIRFLIEPYAARRAAERMDDVKLARLDDITDAMEKAGASHEFAQRDGEFHDYLAQCSGNALIVDALTRLHTHLHIIRLRFDREITDDTVGEHHQLIEALRRRDGDAAEKAMRSHLERSYARLARFTRD